MTVGNYISRLSADSRSWKVALAWISFMFFFTYTDLVVALLVAGDTFKPAFQDMHIKSVSLFVNLGLVIMLLFDFSSKHATVHRNWMWTGIIGLILALVIFFHASLVANNTHSNLVFPLNCDILSIIVFCIFLLFIFILKTFVEFEDVSEVTQVGEI